jgi:hypothetical protein
MFIMCGRYASYLAPEFIARLFGTVNPLPDLQPTWNLAPTDGAPVVRLAAHLIGPMVEGSLADGYPLTSVIMTSVKQGRHSCVTLNRATSCSSGRAVQR